MKYLYKIFDRQLVISLGLIIALLIADTVLSYQNIRQLNDSADWVSHTEKVLNGLGEILMTMTDAETSQRGYIITGEDRYLGPYKSALSVLDGKITQVKALTADNLHQQASVSQLQNLIAIKLEEMQRPITLRRKNFEAARQFILSDAGKTAMDAIRMQVAQMRQEELSLLEARKYRSGQNYLLAIGTVLIANALCLILIAGFIFLLRRNLVERLAAARVIHEQREWYRTTLASIGDSVIATDMRARVTYLNAEAEKMTGWTLEDALNQPLNTIFNIVNEDTRAPVANPVDTVIAEGRVVGLANHTVLIARNGAEHPIADTAAPIRSADGTPVGCILVFHDVSDHRTLEKELKRQAEMLMDRDRRKDEFLAMLAHELRNPLAPISNTLHILESASALKNTQQEAVEIASRQVSHMVRLLDDLLDVSRITHGKITLHRRNLDLREVVRIAVDGAKPLLSEREHALDIRMPESPVWVSGDETRLAQLLGNLLNNAAKYTNARGKITLEIIADNPEVTVCLRDNGIGISKDKIEHIFDMFVQVDSSMERSQGGLGIGLMLVKNIAQMHGGAVTAFSDGTGKGTVFTVKLPVLEHGRKGEPRKAETKLEPSSESYRLLIVDDNTASAKTLGWMAEALGHTVKLAFDAKSAIETAHSYAPDVVLLDIGLPDMNGYEVCQILRKDPALANTVFIAQTGWGQEEHLQRSKEAGFDFHLIKPIKIDALQAQLEQLDIASRSEQTGS